MKRKFLIASVFGLLVLAWTLACFGVSGATAAGRTPTTAPAPKPTPRPAAPAFLLAVCQQPAESLAGWKAIGINCVVDVPQDNDPIAWRDEANRLGLWQIRAVIGDPKLDAQQPFLFAWDHDDEADAKGEHPDVLQAEHDATAGLGVPWFGNFSGGYVLGWQGAIGNQTSYAGWLNACEIVSSDIYPVSGWDNNVPLSEPFRCFSRLRAWTGGKPQFIYIEASKQNLSWLTNGGRAPTKDEFTYLLRSARAIGARGVILFPQQIGGGFKFDVMPAELKNAFADFAAGK
jgi:hypothetical protein